MKSKISKSILLILSTFAVAALLTQFVSKSNFGLNEILSSLRGESLGDQTKPRPTNTETGLATSTETATADSISSTIKTPIVTDTTSPTTKPKNSNSSYIYLILFAVFAIIAVGSFMFLRMRKSSDQFDQLKRKWQ